MAKTNKVFCFFSRGSMSRAELGWAAPQTAAYEDLERKFRPIFEKVAEGAVAREAERRLPYEEIGWLKEAGFGAVRIPHDDGGSGATLPEFFGLLIELAAAESNIPQALRAHFGAVEDVLNGPGPLRARWLPRFARGDLLGSAYSEGAGNKMGSFATTLTKQSDGLLLDGTKYYSTGTLFADWINFGAVRESEVISGFVSATALGVTRLDDWDGFGQRLTGSGTTVFKGTPVDQDDLLALDSRSPYRTAFFQLVHLATLSGISRAATRELAAQVAGRDRTYTHGAARTWRNDPQILQTVGQVRSLAYAAGAITLQAAETVQQAYQPREAEADRTIAVTNAEITVAQAQPVVIKLVLEATTLLFDALGASATSRATALDRHWRNARTISSHNPLIYKQRIVGDFAVNGTVPPAYWMVGS